MKIIETIKPNKVVGLVGAGNIGLEIAVKKAITMNGECFVILNNGEYEIIDPSRIMAVDIQKDQITIMKGVQCGKTESIFNNIDYLGSFRSDFAERNIRNIRNQFVPDYVKKSLRELCIEK